MPDTRWQKVEELFLAAAALEPAARGAFLTDACSEDPSLRDEVDAILRADSFDSDPLADAIGEAAQDFADQLASSRVGERVGSYRLVDVIGHGGMGTVYLAERADDAYRARVAIKFVRGALAAPDLVRRLVAERQILADLNHPGIARLLDGGTAADGTPYLVLEYVEGAPIDDWCDAHRLGVRERVQLFVKVCEAVQYAHDARVVHRDLKPSNILIAADGTPKLVDFGIAKLMAGGDGTETTTVARALTPAYASPEQVKGGAVTASTDVYSLGVVLYRLLALRVPFDLSKASAGEVERRICREPPLPVSRAVKDRDAAWRADVSDFDAVVAKALRKDAVQRFASVTELAEALRAWLSAPARRRSWRRAWIVAGPVRRTAAVASAIVVVMTGIASLALAGGADADIAFHVFPAQDVVTNIRSPARVFNADVNGDGRRDLVWSHVADSINEFAVGVGQSDGTFVMQPAVRHPAPRTTWADFQLLLGDFNADGRQDLAWNRAANTLANVLYLAFANADGSFTFSDSLFLSWSGNRWATGWQVQVGDVNGDRADDLVFNYRAETNTVRVFPMKGDSVLGEIGPFTHFAQRWSGYRHLVADVNGDGLADVLWNDVPVWNNRIYVARSAADRFDLLAHQDHAIKEGWEHFAVVVADLHGDGMSDVIWSGVERDSLVVFVARGQASSVFAYEPRQAFALTGGVNDATPVVGDFNGDGRDDLLWSGPTGAWALAGTRSGASGITALGAVIPAGNSSTVLTMDVNGDARDDLVWLDPSGNRITVWRAGRSRD